MVLNNIKLINFRAHGETEVSLESGLNIISGPNGLGKTNILEAVHYLCLTKSFLTSSDRYVLKREASHFDIEGHFESGSGRALKVRIAFSPSEGKKIFVNGAHTTRASEFVGRIPVVVFSPDDYVITAGGPEERRRFIDTMISQSSRLYLDDLMRYKRVLKQRNELLQRARRHSSAPEAMLVGSWTSELIDVGSRIYATRLAFASKFSGMLADAYTRIGSAVERPGIRYEPLPGLEDEALETIKSAFTQRLADVERREQERGVTLEGPHRDDLHFTLDELPVRRYASQGQHRSFGMALKMAQYYYLLEATEETPILLLDDVFDNLDQDRIGVFTSILKETEMGQCLITAARREIFSASKHESDENHIDIRETMRYSNEQL
jgi:DNA replication and repair protein RecF